MLRYLVQGWLHRSMGSSLPIGTIAVNVSGCLLIGILGTLLMGPRPIHADYRTAILTGVLGGYTTFSAFAWETVQLSDNRQFLHASLNVLISIALGLAAAWLGRQMVQG